MIYVDFAQPISLPPYWLNHPSVVAQVSDNMTQDDVLSVPHACPIKIKWASEAEWWQLPIEPVVTIQGKNRIIKRDVLKASDSNTDRRGSVKELWCQDDYEISISGIFIGYNGELPESDIRKLRKYCEGRESIQVSSPLFTLFNITKVAIEDYQFPFTKGLENQMFSIKTSSDDFDEKILLMAVE